MHLQPIPHGYCQCGCGELTPLAKQTCARDGYRKGDPKRFASAACATRYHRESKPRELDFEIDPQTSCWVWLKAKDRHGYGNVRRNRRLYGAHVHVYRRFFDLPDGLELDHLCRNHACVNPAHLEPVTHAENMRRASVTRLTIGQVRRIRERSEDGADALSLAIEYGVSRTHIYRIRKHAIWKE